MPVCLRGMHSFMRTHLPLLFFFKFRRRDMSTVFLPLSSSPSPTCLFSFFVFPAIFFISSFSFLRRTSPSKDAHFALGLKRTEKERGQTKDEREGDVTNKMERGGGKEKRATKQAGNWKRDGRKDISSGLSFPFPLSDKDSPTFSFAPLQKSWKSKFNVRKQKLPYMPKKGKI